MRAVLSDSLRLTALFLSVELESCTLGIAMVCSLDDPRREVSESVESEDAVSSSSTLPADASDEVLEPRMTCINKVDRKTTMSGLLAFVIIISF